MRQDGSLPTVDTLFGSPHPTTETAPDEARTVYSPAAYLAELLKLLSDAKDDGTGGAPAAIAARRPDILSVPLDAENAGAEVPYLDIVNDVLAKALTAGGTRDADQLLRDATYPFGLPFSQPHERVRRYLRHLGVDAVELYRAFAPAPDADTVAREFLGLTTVDVELVTTVLPDGPDLRACFGLGENESYTALESVERFRDATTLTAAELGELLAGGDVTVDGENLRHATGAVPVEWFERVNRFVRLARRTGLTLTDLDLVLRDCCGNRIDAAALRTIAVVVHLRRELDLPVDVVVSLVAPMSPDLSDRVFAALSGLTCTGDILNGRNAAYRRVLAAALSISDGDLTAIVTRFRRTDGPGPFDPPVGAAALALVHRIARLAGALGVTVTELFDVLDALDRDPSVQRHPAFPVLIDPGVTVDRVDAVLAGGDVAAGLWLTQTLIGTVRWMRSTGLTGAELNGVLAADDGPAAVLGRLAEEFAAVALAPARFVSDRFGERSAQVIHGVVASDADGVVSPGDDRLLRVDPVAAAGTAYTAVAALPVLVAADFYGLGLGDRVAAKLFTNLVLAGYVDAYGTLVPASLPEDTDELRLAGDFDAWREPLFALLAGFCAVAGEGEPAECQPSDLLGFDDLTAADQAELYDNLIFNGHLDPDGLIVDPAFFADAANVEAFAVDADLDALAGDVHLLLTDRIAASARVRPEFDPAIVADLGLTAGQLADLLDSLRFNGYLDNDGRYTDPDALLAATDLHLALEFHPHRRRVLAAVQGQLGLARSDALGLTEDDVRGIADAATAQRVVDALDGTYLVDGRVPADVAPMFADPGNELAIDGFTAAENATVFDRVAAVLAEARPYHLDLDALTELGFDAEQRAQLVEHLVAEGHLTATLTVPEDRLDHFGTVHNALGFELPGLEDYRTDVFFLLHSPAVETAAAVAEILTALSAGAAAQRATVFTVLQDEFGVPAASVEAICAAVAGGVDDALDLLAVPALRRSTLDTVGLRAFRRIRGFARLAAKLALGADEVALAFRDQGLVDKFPEPLGLPPGVDRIDAVLESSDGRTYLFHDRQVWTYSTATRALTDPRPRALTDLSTRFTALVRVDAAYVDATGADWIVGRDDKGAGLAFARDKGSGRWGPRTRVWGRLTNNFTDPARIDAAFVDHDGRTYLFAGDQYVRYSGADHAHVDEGYPRRIGDWWETEQHSVALPEEFRHSLDAAFRGHDGRTYLFAGDTFIAVGGEAGSPADHVWGTVRNELAAADHVDAAYATGSAQFLFAGDQVVRYTDSIENDGVRADSGYPHRIGAEFPHVPAGFDSGLSAAFVDPTGVPHLFKDDRTVALDGESNAVVPTASRWGRLDPVLPDGKVDAAFVGLDGRTYLFSGDRYLRYSGAEYSTVDTGYPRAVAGDWGGLRAVDAAFVLDDATFLFGAPGRLFDVSADHATVLDTGRVPGVLRQRLADHGLPVDADATVTGAAPAWQLTADRCTLTLRLVDTRVEVHVEPTTVQFHVRYSTRDYAMPDPGFPRPVGDNWWNLPDELLEWESGTPRVDAVLTAADSRTYVFRGATYVVFDSKRRWWSEPRTLRDDWASLPFGSVAAAFVGADGRTYVFSDDGRYVRYTGGDHTRVDARYPAPVTSFWGNVVNTIARTGRVDAALVAGEHTYLFSGDQYVRYTGTAYGTVDAGYPRSLEALSGEPRLGNLRTRLTRVDAAFADRRTVHLFDGDRWHVASDAAYRRYTDVPGPVTCAFVEDGAVLVERDGGWFHYSALEGATVATEPVRPRGLRAVPERFHSGLDAVLHGVDGNTYLFKGPACFNTRLDREYPLAEEWGRPRNAIYHENRVDAAFVGADGRTHVFSGDQFVTYPGVDYLDAEVETEPRPIAEHWGGLRTVALAFTRDDVTYLFEAPDETGAVRMVAYSGKEYSRPDDGFPAVVDASFWGIPEEYRPAGFTLPDAVLVDDDSMLLLTGGTGLHHDGVTGTWSYARPVERLWPGIGRADGLTAAFTGRDAATYFFFHDDDSGTFTRYDGRAFTPREEIRDRWGRTRNNFLARDGAVDAAVVTGGVTYLFSGDQYARYSGGDYRYVDAGYPKAVAGNLRREDAFANLPATFDDELAERVATGNRPIDAVVANGRTAYVFTGDACHAVSRELTATYELALGGIRNTILDRGRVDAALVTDAHTYLFSGDQYVRYTGRDYDRVDDGYPRLIAAGLPAELGVAELPAPFRDGIDAAVRAADGTTYLFTGKRYLTVAGGTATVADVAGTWGVVRSGFAPGTGIDAAFMAPTGELYAFAGGQYVRYLPDRPETVEQGFPQPVDGNWGDLPSAFARAIDGAFTVAGRTYLCSGTDYVRVTDDPDHLLPQPVRHRWTDRGDYHLHDLRAITRFTGLARAHPGDGGLAAFLLPGAHTVADPYRHLADLFGWDVDEVRWCRRTARLRSGAPVDENRLEIEFLLYVVDLFALTDRLGAGPSRVREDVWTNVFEGGVLRDRDAAAARLTAAADALYALLARRHGDTDWPAAASLLHDELNEARRDALVPAVIARTPGFRTSRDLFDWFLIDVDMGSRGRTSRVREAIAAVQLYVHRYLLDLEETADATAPDDPADAPDPAVAEATRRRVKEWWTWMRSYRVWEANRKVFLYPENYLRPELRQTRTPAFRTLESDLLQGEITPDSVDRAYRRYLDEYSEVSRLTIAGGYVYTKDRTEDGPRRLVLFGRTKTDPRRYHYRLAEFGSGGSATWEPWLPVDVQIDADHVHPVHAFGRVFVFWATVEMVSDADNPATATVVVADKGAEQQVSGRAKTQRVSISYSFLNLNNEWVPVQALGTGPALDGVVSDLMLLVRPRVKESTGGTSVVVSCSYKVTTAAGSRRDAVLFDLNPELYADDLLDADHASGLTPDGVAVTTDLENAAAATATAARVAGIFADPVDPADVVRFDHPSGASGLSWFSVDHKGGSFLCRPVRDLAPEPAVQSLAGSPDGLPAWGELSAAVELPDRTRYFFASAMRLFVTAPPTAAGKPGTPLAEPEAIGARWGRQRVVLPPELRNVDAVFTRGRYTFVLSGEHYIRFTDTPFERIDDGYPKRIAENTEGIPRWATVDAAFTDRDGIEYFFTNDTFVTSADINAAPRPGSEHWSRAVDGFGRVDAALVTDKYTIVFSQGAYLKWTHKGDSGYGKPDYSWPTSIMSGDRDLVPPGQLDAAVWRDGTSYYFSNRPGGTLEYTDGTWHGYTYRAPATRVSTDQTVDAAWIANGKLYLTSGTEVIRYTLNTDGSVPRVVDGYYPKTMPRPVTAAFTRDNDVYLFTGDTYVRIDAWSDPETAPEPRPVAGVWGGLPETANPPFQTALDSVDGLFLILGDTYVRHSKTAAARRPYELSQLPFELIRLTTGTASELNRKLLSGGVPALLDLTTQEADEVAVGTAGTGATIVVRPDMVDPDRLPTGSHLDFRSANGLYYWEIFFHAPLLIAQALNSAQRFEYARQWYEYVFDPTNTDSCWRFLPFLSFDLSALADAVAGDVAEIVGGRRRAAASDLEKAMEPVLAHLRALAPVGWENRPPVTDGERAALLAVTSPAVLGPVEDALRALEAKRLSAGQRAAVASLRERTAVIADLPKQFVLLGDHESLLRAYRERPFDPHAIADLRPVALRRAVVMGYIDNLLDWGDLLFRQYTAESIDEARMLYILAHDLLGERADRLGTQAAGVGLEDQHALTASVADPQFHVPENGVFSEYGDRVTDRLRKIRQSLTILGISQPLPLFEPALDPTALAAAGASGSTVDVAMAGGATVAPPPYRFAVVFRRAQELVDKLRQFGADLVAALERRDAEELSQLQARQEGTILALTREIKRAQVRIAETRVAELMVGQTAAQDRAAHYDGLIATGLTALERAQLDVMATAASSHFASSVLKVAASLGHSAPQVMIGPFILGIKVGGDQIGSALELASDVTESLGEGFSVVGEMIGIKAQHERSTADWELQARTARTDLLQIGHQITGATHELAIARGEADLLDRQIAHHEEVDRFMRDTFGSVELYGWLSGQLSGLYFQAYQLAYEMALSAEKAFQFERGTTGSVIRPTYWQSRRGGLLAGESLGLDLDRLQKAYMDGDATRGMEITKQVSLLDNDPLALLRLRETGTCEFALTEALFDQDFPGHYRRQIRAMAVTFVDADGNPLRATATLTQLGHKTVLEPDIEAVRHLLDPKGLPPRSVRGDWRPGQRIALSDVDGENNGLFELRYDDDKYLPFEGTGAVSTWRLERSGRILSQPYDVVLTVRYTARPGDGVFTNAVRGTLKPYTAARFFDVAREFPEEWTAFVEGADKLALPLTTDLFPGMRGRQIAAIYPAYETASSARLVLNGTQNVPLSEGRLQATPGLSIGTAPVTFTAEGDRGALTNVGLVLTYQAMP